MHAQHLAKYGYTAGRPHSRVPAEREATAFHARLTMLTRRTGVVWCHLVPRTSSQVKKGHRRLCSSSHTICALMWLCKRSRRRAAQAHVTPKPHAWTHIAQRGSYGYCKCHHGVAAGPHPYQGMCHRSGPCASPMQRSPLTPLPALQLHDTSLDTTREEERLRLKKLSDERAQRWPNTLQVGAHLPLLQAAACFLLPPWLHSDTTPHVCAQRPLDPGRSGLWRSA
jgi:hypothetical protein